jgi:hypothetical protein
MYLSLPQGGRNDAALSKCPVLPKLSVFASHLSPYGCGSASHQICQCPCPSVAVVSRGWSALPQCSVWDTGQFSRAGHMGIRLRRRPGCSPSLPDSPVSADSVMIWLKGGRRGACHSGRSVTQARFRCLHCSRAWPRQLVKDKQEPHPFGSGCGGLEEDAGNDETGCAQCAHFGLRIGPYIGRTGSDCVCFRGSGEFAGAGMRFESDEGWMYLCAVRDACSRRVIGWAMDSVQTSSLVERALRMAYILRGGGPAGVVFHADRGTQYTSTQLNDVCTGLGIHQSVGRTGVCWDNAMRESFWSTLKTEFYDRRRWKTRQAAIRATGRWIEEFYNRARLHSALDYATPVEHERFLTTNKPQPAQAA